jgi:hypothetical protein
VIDRTVAPYLYAAVVVVGSGLAVPVFAQASSTLSRSSPSVEIALPPRTEGALLEVKVIAVRNPDDVPVSLRVLLQDAQRRAPPEDVMRFALFPPDRPGASVARPDDALERLRRSLGVAPTRLVALVTFDLSAGDVPTAPRAELQVEATWTGPPPAPERR